MASHAADSAQTSGAELNIDRLFAAGDDFVVGECDAEAPQQSAHYHALALGFPGIGHQPASSRSASR